MNKNGGEGLMSTLLFKHVNVVDVRNQQILSDVDVLIKNERIEKMERDIKSSAEQVVDGEGKYLSPGIIDMHVHSTWDGSAISEDMDEMYGPYQAFLRSVHNVENSLKKGVTTIREVGSPKDLSIETAFAVEKGLKVRELFHAVLQFRVYMDMFHQLERLQIRKMNFCMQYGKKRLCL